MLEFASLTLPPHNYGIFHKFYFLNEAFPMLLRKKNYGKFHNLSDPPPILTKIMENFEKYLLFYGLIKGIILK